MFEPNKGHILTFPWRRSIRDETVDDLIGARELAEQLDGEVVPTGLSPGQYRDVIQQLDFFVCQSLHAAMWAFHSNVPFLVHNYHSKIAFWADERNLWDHVFSKTDQIPDMFVQKFTFDGDTAKRDIEQAHKGLERVCQLLS
jgi:polysaccharide pyruvyl transferase WcaK-like protein